MNIIEVENLTHDYGHGRGVFDVSFAVKQGEVFGFLGPNGAGKSTTIRHIMGFSRPQKGETKVFGLESFHNYYKILSRVGYLPGEIALPEGLTGTEFVKMMGDLRKSNNQERLNYLLKKFDLSLNIDTKSMGLGDKRKLAIVTAFMHDPDVLVLDEPTSGLDPIMQQNFIDFIREEKKRGKTILLSSHMFSEVEATCDRVAIIKDGRIVSTFETDSIKHNENKNFEVYFYDEAELGRFVAEMPKAKIVVDQIKKFGIKSVDAKNLKAIVLVQDKDINEVVMFISKFNVKEFRQISFTLQDYFMQFYYEDKDFGGALVWKKK